MAEAGVDLLVTYGNAWQSDYLRYATDYGILEGEGVAIIRGGGEVTLYLDSPLEADRAQIESPGIKTIYAPDMLADVEALLERSRNSRLGAAPKRLLPRRLAARVQDLNIADRTAMVDGLGAAGLKKLELAKAIATGPKLLLADESLGGLDEHEMDQAADMLRRIRKELGITIIWVEHIMGVLMRVVDRVMVLDHGEKISEGLPSEVSSDPKVVEVYLGTDADATQAAAARARR
jgi:ABC-type sugar transport system ATPase subunit